MRSEPGEISTRAVGLTIGAVSRATGVPTSTLRTWERRYGFPSPSRTAGRQRLYDAAVVGRLRLVARALELGHRPSQIMGASLERLLQLAGQRTIDRRRPGVAVDWFDATRRLDGLALGTCLRFEASRLGLHAFVRDFVGPFLDELGDAWARGDLQTYHEHFASERVRALLASQWTPLADRATGPRCVLATLTGEHHALGLHLVATVLALHGYRIVFLGADVPPADVAACAADVDARAVMISASRYGDGQRLRRDLVELAGVLPDDIELVVGGAGAGVAPDRARVIFDFDALSLWATTAAPAAD